MWFDIHLTWISKSFPLMRSNVLMDCQKIFCVYYDQIEIWNDWGTVWWMMWVFMFCNNRNSRRVEHKVTCLGMTLYLMALKMSSLYSWSANHSVSRKQKIVLFILVPYHISPFETRDNAYLNDITCQCSF